MASIRISELPEAFSLNRSLDIIPIVANDVTSKVSLNTLSTFLSSPNGFNTFLPLTGGRITGSLTVTQTITAVNGITVGNSTSPSDFFVSSNGNIGIGTENPNTKLTVIGSISAVSTSIIFKDLPTSSVGLEPGSLYVESGFLKIA